MRVYKNKYYILRTHPGISGFQRWDKYEYRLVTGKKARFHRLNIYKEFRAKGLAYFRLENGHLPDYQPGAKEADALRWLDENPYGSVFFVGGLEHYSLEERINQ